MLLNNNHESFNSQFSMLQQEYHKLNRKYQTIKSKFDEIVCNSNEKDRNNSFPANLINLVKNLHNNKKYSDVNIKLSRNFVVPAHKFVLEAHQISLDMMGNEIDMSFVDPNIAEQIIKWIYTLELNDNQCFMKLWKIVECAQLWDLDKLKTRCSRALLSKLDLKNCLEFYRNSCRYSVDTLRNHCSEYILMNWEYFHPDDFIDLDATMLLDLVEFHSEYPLHKCIEFQRDDAAFLFLNRNFAELNSIINLPDKNNRLILDLALELHKFDLCQSLIKHGADVNSIDSNGMSLLHLAILRCDELSANFLIENACHLNPLTNDQMQTPLQLLISQRHSSENTETFNQIAKTLICNGCDINHYDSNELTALSLAILTNNRVVIESLLESGRCTSINGSASTQYSIKSSSISSSITSKDFLSCTSSMPVLPLWLAISMKYKRELLLDVYQYIIDLSSSIEFYDIIPLLIEWGADCCVAMDTVSGNTILMHTVTNQLEDAALQLVKLTSGMSVNSQHQSQHNSASRNVMKSMLTCCNHSRESVLHLAVEHQMIQLTRELLLLGADANAVRRKTLLNQSVQIPDDNDSCCSDDSILDDSGVMTRSLSGFSEHNFRPPTDRTSNPENELRSSSNSMDDLNPFKDFMDNEQVSNQSSSGKQHSRLQSHNLIKQINKTDKIPSSNSAPTKRRIFHKQTNSGQGAIILRSHNQNTNTTKKFKKRVSNKPTTNHHSSSAVIDCSTSTQLAVLSDNVELVRVFVEHSIANKQHNSNPVDWLAAINNGCGTGKQNALCMLLCCTRYLLAGLADKLLQHHIITQLMIDKLVVPIDNQLNGESTLCPLLHAAIYRGQKETIQFLIKIGCDINIRESSSDNNANDNFNSNNQYLSALQLAAQLNDAETVRLLCKSGADYNAIVDNPQHDLCALWIGLKYKFYNIAQILVESGADVDVWHISYLDGCEQNLLHRAILEKQEQAALFLIEHGADVLSPREIPDGKLEITQKLKSLKGDSPLHLSCRLGLTEVVRRLLTQHTGRKIDCNSQNIHGDTPLHLAINNQHQPIIDILLNRNQPMKLNLSVKDTSGHTPFHVAMLMANQNAARKIIEFESNAANEMDNCGRNFLHLALQTMNEEAVFFLISVAADLNKRVQDSMEHSPLHLSVIHGAPEHMVRSLILAGAKINELTTEKQNLLHLSVQYKRHELVECLLDNGCLLTHQDYNLDTPLHLAMKFGIKSIIEVILPKAACCINMKNLKGKNVIHVLAQNAKENAVVILSILLEHFPAFPLDDKDADGNTALLLAAMNNHFKLSCALINKGASLGCVNSDGVHLFNTNQISSQLLDKMLDAIEAEPAWLDGDICVSCSARFTIKNRKHHCRHCGRLICAKCSLDEIPILKFNVKKPVRVCNICFNFLVNGSISHG